MLRSIRLSGVWLLSLVLGLVLGLASCGGGTGDTQANGSGVGSGGTGSYSNGPVSGLGSIIVNGLRYDVTGAAVHRDDDANDSVVHDPSEVKVGMMVAVSGSGSVPAGNGGLPLAAAYTVRYGSSLIGPVSAVDLAGATITVLGQTVRITAKTVQPALPLNVNDVVEVHGLADAMGGYIATRIDTLDGSTSTYKIVALVNSVDDLDMHLGLNGNLIVSYGAAALPAGVTPGARVRVWFGATQVNGQWSATRIRVDQPLVTDTEEASLEGLVTSLPHNGVMQVDGSPVDVSRLSSSSVSGLTLGERVRVEGRLQAGVLVATELEDPSVLESEETELYGAVSQLSGQTFVVRGVTVAYTPSVVEGTLANGACVEVHGHGYNSSGALNATEVNVHSGCN
ncbi:MAG: hypothetical protein HY019_10560 [Aquabacterium sp.]|uniref:DUF5666 domain-containing protein n=1 Tax=Aquabacterium sp. TaxID=1872578 RepID=UPI0025C67ADB|nr:DUF5666 domain-containing protein [Aquabacterium sp.]MBI3382434.1 hypothetical protein [Aquabacterium sp.]